MTRSIMIKDNNGNETIEAQFSRDGQLEAVFLQIPGLDTWINMTEEVTERTQLMDLIHEEYEIQKLRAVLQAVERSYKATSE